MKKPCEDSSGHSFASIVLKLGQNVCPNDCSDEFEYGSSGVKKLGHNSQIWKILVNTVEATFAVRISWKFVRKVDLMISLWIFWVQKLGTMSKYEKNLVNALAVSFLPHDGSSGVQCYSGER
ncbi:hypothetical protein ACF0H5_008744 [Mactra antiquata]